MAPKLRQAARRGMAKAKSATLSESSATASQNMAKRVRQNDGSTTAKEARVAEQPPLRVPVHALSGRLLCMLEVSPGDTALLFTRAGHYLKASSTIVAAGLRDEAVVTARVALPRLFAIASEDGGAFAALKGDGSVLCWGDRRVGGDCSAVQQQLVDVVDISAAAGQFGEGAGAFAALKSDGTVLCWGDRGTGGDCSAVQQDLKDVVEISSATIGAFAARARHGSVVCWGEKLWGGDCSTVQQQLVDVEKIYATPHGAFAAVKKDRTVVCWGSIRGNMTRQQLLNAAEKICANLSSFAAVTEDGRVACWGDEGWGGDCSEVQEQLVEVEEIYAAYFAFAAFKKDGAVQQLVDVEKIYANTDAFAALKKDGTKQLVDVETIYATERAFAAVKKDRTVVCWGSERDGGDCSAVQQQRVDVETIHATRAAFAAVLRNGSVVCWGDARFGGDCSTVQQLEKVAVIEAAMTCFFVTKADGSGAREWHLLDDVCGTEFSLDGCGAKAQALFSRVRESRPLDPDSQP
ncbi:unnamed protein product [Prorocentrum cordatum]|uniref:Uncharacterized protein n=1 Tax=Prorocentrum cordatum TaxID=2364126 RepID=A0ABN9UAF7_9DINO|nr:unnamed protein product [Polarella glacialis]